jgi:hypothetical protein
MVCFFVATGFLLSTILAMETSLIELPVFLELRYFLFFSAGLTALTNVAQKWVILDTYFVMKFLSYLMSFICGSEAE